MQKYYFFPTKPFIIGIFLHVFRENPFFMHKKAHIFAAETNKSLEFCIIEIIKNIGDTIMKKMMFTLIAMLTIAATANAMSYEQARNEALFLTDKMAYELNLSDSQYEAAYEINLDYLMSVATVDDLYGTYWERRNLDLSYVLFSWQWDLYRAASYFFRPLYWNAGYWHFGIYARYPHRDYFYFGRPHFYASYRGGHSWRMNGGRSFYEGHRDHYRPGHITRDNHFGMRNGWDRGDYRNNHGHSSSTRITAGGRGNSGFGSGRNNNSDFGRGRGHDNNSNMSNGTRGDMSNSTRGDMSNSNRGGSNMHNNSHGNFGGSRNNNTTPTRSYNNSHTRTTRDVTQQTHNSGMHSSTGVGHSRTPMRNSESVMSNRSSSHSGSSSFNRGGGSSRGSSSSFNRGSGSSRGGSSHGNFGGARRR